MVKGDISISIESSPAPKELQIIGNGLWQQNDQHIPVDGDSFFAVFLPGEDGVILGDIFRQTRRGG